MTERIKQCDVVKSCVDCPRYGDDCDGDKRIETTDSISRADAIEEISKGVWNEQELIDRINALPSAEAEWIPCSDRLPSEDGLYLIQTNYMYHGIPNMDVYYWAEGWNCLRRCDGTVVREYEIDGVIAWMLLPKPYREESEVEE